MRAKHHKTERTERQLRVGELVRHVLATSIMRHDFSGSRVLQGMSLSVSEVRVSIDLSQATVFMNSLQGVPNQEELSELKNFAGFFRKVLATSLSLRVVPQLHFVADYAAENSTRIDSLLNSSRVKCDLDS